MGSARANPSSADALIWDDYLFPPQQLVASGCYYHAPMQSDGNLVVYGGNRALWASNTVGTGGYARMQLDGNFVIYNWADSPVWSTNTGNTFGAQVSMQSDGNLVLYTGLGKALWSSRTAGESVAQSPCTLTGEHTFVTVDYDRPGGDYKVLIPNQARASWCGFFCAGDSMCKAYTYVPSSRGGTGACHLKNMVPDRVSRAGFVSGMKQF